MHRIQISNQIFDQGLSVAAISVYAYLCSIKGNVCNGFTHVKVKQKTIAAACGIASVQTVAKAIRELTEIIVTATRAIIRSRARRAEGFTSAGIRISLISKKESRFYISFASHLDF